MVASLPSGWIKFFTPRRNGKAERYQPIMAEEVLYAHEYHGDDER